MNKYDQYRACPKCGVRKEYGNDQTGWNPTYLGRPKEALIPWVLCGNAGEPYLPKTDGLIHATCKSCGYVEFCLPRDAKEPVNDHPSPQP